MYKSSGKNRIKFSTCIPYSCTLTLLNSFFRVPLLRGKLNVVVESGLRIASMVVKSDYSVIGDARKFFLSVLADL